MRIAGFTLSSHPRSARPKFGLGPTDLGLLLGLASDQYLVAMPGVGICKGALCRPGLSEGCYVSNIT